MTAIADVTIEKLIAEKNDYLKRNFVRVFSSNSVTPFINFYRLAKKKDSTYPFSILNTDEAIYPVHIGGIF